MEIELANEKSAQAFALIAEVAGDRPTDIDAAIGRAIRRGFTTGVQAIQIDLVVNELLLHYHDGRVLVMDLPREVP